MLPPMEPINVEVVQEEKEDHLSPQGPFAYPFNPGKTGCRIDIVDEVGNQYPHYKALKDGIPKKVGKKTFPKKCLLFVIGDDSFKGDQNDRPDDGNNTTNNTQR